MNDHSGNCVWHLSVPRGMAKAIHQQAAREDVQADGGSFRAGTPGENEWEATSGAVKWWPRWGKQGEASLFGDFYFRWGDQVEICLDLFTVDNERECPWYRLPTPARVAMAKLAFWQLAARAFAHKVRGYEQAITRDLVPSDREWNPWFVEQFREAVQAMGQAMSQVSLAEADLRRALTDQHDLLRRLVDWADLMGGWEAPVWQEVYTFVEPSRKA